VRSGVGLSGAQQRKLRTLNHYLQVSPLLEYRANKMFEAIKGAPTLNSPLIKNSAAIQGVLPGLGHFAHEAISRLSGAQRTAKKFVLRGFLDQFPVRDNHVYLSRHVDRFGMPKANVRWSFSRADMDSVIKLFEYLDGAFRKQGIGWIEYSTLRERSDWPIIGIHSHFLGTTRMGRTPKSGVVDLNCRVFGAENCYVSGPSTFPAYGYANPFLTIVAMSLRLGDHLIERLKSQKFDVVT